MRVLLLCGSFPPMRCGVGDYTSRLAGGLAALPDCDVSVLTGKEADPASAPGATVLPLMAHWDIPDLPAIARIIRERRPDILHMQIPTLVYGRSQWLIPSVALALGVPNVQTWHEYYAPRFWPHALNASLPGGLVAVRPGYIDKLPPFWKKLVARKRFRFIPNASAIPVAPLTPAERADIRGRHAGPEETLVVYFGFVSRAKGVDTIFDIADPKTSRILLVCDLDPSDADHKAILDRMNAPPWNGRAKATGFLPPDEVAQLLASADVAVFPFRNGGGEWNTSIHAAKAQGTFVLTTSINEPTGYRPDENMHVARPRDIDDMRRALARHAKTRIAPPRSTTDWPAIAAAHLALYKEILTDRGRS